MQERIFQKEVDYLQESCYGVEQEDRGDATGFGTV